MNFISNKFKSIKETEENMLSIIPRFYFNGFHIDFPFVDSDYDRLLSHILIFLAYFVFFVAFTYLAMHLGTYLNKLESSFNYLKVFYLKDLALAKGFTLIELMVVIAIIAILAAVGLTIFAGQQKSARDARRKADINAISKALEVKKSTSISYLPLTTSDFTAGVIPTDSTPHYSVCYSNSSANLSGQFPTAWNPASANPTAPTGSCQGSAWVDLSSTNPPATAVNWILCTYLEASYNSTNPYTIGQSATYCRANTQ